MRRTHSGVSPALSGRGASFSTHRIDTESYAVPSGTALASSSASPEQRCLHVRTNRASVSQVPRSDLSPNSSEALAAIQRLREVRGYNLPSRLSPLSFPTSTSSSSHGRLPNPRAGNAQLASPESVPGATQPAGRWHGSDAALYSCSLYGQGKNATLSVDARSDSEARQLVVAEPGPADRARVMADLYKEASSSATSRDLGEAALLCATHPETRSPHLFRSSSSDRSGLTQEEPGRTEDCEASGQVKQERGRQAPRTQEEGPRRAPTSPETSRSLEVCGDRTTSRSAAVQAVGQNSASPPTEEEARFFLASLLKSPLHNLPLAPSLMERIRRHWAKAARDEP